MTKHERRLQALEHALLHVSLEREVDQHLSDPDVQREIADAANRYGLDHSELEAEMRIREIRIRQVGWSAYLQEVSEELGLPLETLADSAAMERYIDQMHAAEVAHWEDIRSKQEFWWQGVLYRGGEPQGAA